MTKTIVLFVFVAIFFPSSSHAGAPAVFMFGDSLLDAGTNSYVPKAALKANFPWNGIDFFNSTPNGRFSNGQNYADFLAKLVFGETATSPPAYLSLFSPLNTFEENLAKALDLDMMRAWGNPVKDFNFASMGTKENPGTGLNFASAGSGIIDSTSVLDQSTPITLQVVQFLTIYANLTATLGSWKTQYLVSKSIYFISCGSSDMFFQTMSQAPVDADKYVATLIESYNKTITTLYNIGARKFGILGVPYIGCTPLMRVTTLLGNCSQTANDLAIKFNIGLENLLFQKMISSRGMIYSYGNAYDMLVNFVENPERYNYTNIYDGCCGLGRFNAMTNCHPKAKLCMNRDGHIFWDLMHPTTKTAKTIIDAFAFKGKKFARPINFSKLARL